MIQRLHTFLLKQYRLFCPHMVFMFIGSVRFSAHVESLWKLQMQSDKQWRETPATSTAAATDCRLLQQRLDSISSTDLSSCSAHTQKKTKKKTSQILVPVALLWCKNKQRNMSVSEADSCFATPVEYLDQTLLWNITPQINRYLYFFLSFSFSLVPQLLHNTSNKPSDISHKEDNWIMGM